MIGFVPLASVPLAGNVIQSGVPVTFDTPAWRRLLAEIEPEARLNVMAPIDLVWHDPDEEEEAILLELIRGM